MTVAAILAAAERAPGRLAVTVPDEWRQGRTLYGGLSVALGHEAARGVSEGLPPLRSVQVAFVGPLSGRIEASAQVLRAGRSTTFVGVDIAGEAGLGLRATFMFTAGRNSALEHENLPAPPVPDADAAAPAQLRVPDKFFAGNLEYRHALPRGERPTPRLLRWVRLVERDGLDPVAALLTLADALPPAAMALMATPGPVSSATWQVNLLTPEPETRDGWWLLGAEAQQIRDGFSSQSMAIWNRDGKPVATGMQSVAIFV